MSTLRGRLRDEAGLSLVEMMIAILVLGVILSAFAGLVAGVFRSVLSNESLTGASALANESLEELQKLEWSELREFEEDWHTVERDGVEYDRLRTVEFTDDDFDEVSEAYARLEVYLEWDDRGRPRDLHMESLRSPTVDEGAMAEFVLHEAAVDPVVIDLDESGEPDDPILDDVILTARTNTATISNEVRVNYDRIGKVDDEAVLTPYAGAGTYVYRRSGLPGEPRFPHGDTTFTFTASFQGDEGPVDLTVERLVRMQRPIDIVEPEPNEVVGSVDEDVVFEFAARGISSDDTVTVSWDGLPEGDELNATVARYDGETVKLAEHDGQLIRMYTDDDGDEYRVEEDGGTTSIDGAVVVGGVFVVEIEEGLVEPGTELTVTVERLADAEEEDGRGIDSVQVLVEEEDEHGDEDDENGDAGDDND